MSRFTNKVFIVTGAGRGIGRAIATRLVADGARVSIVEREAAAGRDAAAELGSAARFHRADVAREPDVRRAIAATVRWGGRLDGVVNNAGIADPAVGPPDKLSLRTWNAFIGSHLTGAFLVAKHAIPHLRKTRGAIVNLGSTRAVQSEPETIAYSAAKGGIAALTHSLAISLGPQIRCNCIEPGWIATSAFAPRGERHAPRLSRRDHAQHPVGRVGRPEDIAGLCAWLLSDEAGFVTGAAYVVDGGMTRKMIYD
jgi:NAD(P)-dependent dehydrogenase (short-subunit alcohol dehydrogenase family)